MRPAEYTISGLHSVRGGEGQLTLEAATAASIAASARADSTTETRARRASSCTSSSLRIWSSSCSSLTMDSRAGLAAIDFFWSSLRAVF